MSNPIPHPALQHLQLTFSVAEYEALLHKYTHVSFGPSKDARDYWEKVPNYLIARARSVARPTPASSIPTAWPAIGAPTPSTTPRCTATTISRLAVATSSP